MTLNVQGAAPTPWPDPTTLAAQPEPPARPVAAPPPARAIQAPEPVGEQPGARGS
ncbi:hypothetical protein [Candidatus Solirubrobacter pratensis]|uniref:hypothetical protein n=1 Tax=Candidatus Solirubrobacter pratensis TaxID=1298857 RepID=UPI000417B554|nr:hypothetical protein [Candidatus Solirubrobacter pratensis]